jgi:hypothetical protein
MEGSIWSRNQGPNGPRSPFFLQPTVFLLVPIDQLEKLGATVREKENVFCWPVLSLPDVDGGC